MHANLEDKQGLVDNCISVISGISCTCHCHLYVVMI